jgi:TonB-linked SusC/RagA family outer membrane protein
MNTIYNKQKIFWLIMMAVVSTMLSAQDAPEDSLSAVSLSTEGEIVNLYFNELNKNRLTGSVNNIDTDAEFSRDSRLSIGSALNGKVPGLIGNYNTWGTGNAVIVIDGVPQPGFYYNSLNLMEVESIVVLKDALSKALYGAMGDQGVILINTKQGDVGPNKIRVSAQYSALQSRAYPKFLNAADDMEKFNEARTNDGLSPLYSLDMIDKTRSGISPALYPDEEFYTEDYLRNFRSSANVIFDVSGGNQNTLYYVNTEWGTDNGWLNTPIPDENNHFNFRGNLNFKINDYMRMGVSGVARLNTSSRPNVNTDIWEDGYWEAFSTILPSAYPGLWDPNLITSQETRDLILKNAILHNGMLLGGNSSYANNQIYGELAQNGTVKYRQSLVQFTGNADVDLGFITDGLSLKAFAGINFYNTLYSEQQYQYAIYQPIDTAGTDMIDTVAIHGIDIKRDQFNTNNEESTYNRQFTYYGRLGYDRNFGMHAVSASALLYGNTLTTEGAFQNQVVLNGGLALNYMYGNRYVVEGAIMGIGSKKLPEGNRSEPTGSAGVAWIISEEGFMDNVSFVNLLKLKASYGITKNDDWGNGNTDYYRWANTFVRGGSFNYNNGGRNNNETEYNTVRNEITLQKREDLYTGIEAVVVNNTLHFQLGYFQSHSMDNLTEMQYLFPQVLGFENLIFANYNSDKTSGIELGLDFSYPISQDLTATVGGNLININPEITKRDEPIYEGEDAALLREGTATDAMWALVANGLYSENDFNPDGSLVDGLPEPTWGGVQPGDIKYLDQNGDGVVDQLDQRIVGHGVRTQYSVYLDLRFRNFGLYALGVGRLGASNTRNSSSYFKVQGNVKYSEYAMQAYGPNNKDLNALNPRLTSLNGGNNDRNSSFWVYENNSFTLPTIQLTYRFNGGNAISFLKDSQVYVRGGNLVVLGKNKEYTEVNPGAAPNTRSFVLGFVTTF